MLSSKVHQTLNLNASLMDIFKHPTIRGLANLLSSGGVRETAQAAQSFTSIQPVEKKQYYPISSAQKRLFILYRLDEQALGYNMPRQFRLQGEIDETKLEQAFESLIKRHESFRTSFNVIGDRTMQVVHETVKFSIAFHENVDSDVAVEGIIRDFVRPFDLSKAPLLRVGLIRASGVRHILMLDMHHVVSDGASTELIIKDFIALYSGVTLPPLKLQYKEYSQWQNSRMESPELKKQENYWLEQFAGDIPVLDLPLDFERPSIRHFEGSRVDFRLNREITSGLDKLAIDSGGTMYMVLFTIYSIFLSRITGQEDIVIGTVNLGRNHADLEKIVGMFVNTMGLRTFPTGTKTSAQLLDEIIATTLTAFENQDYQYDRLVEKNRRRQGCRK